jgi:protein-S-isoprenylcysteine O-methyltransferase Ste14
VRLCCLCLAPPLPFGLALAFSGGALDALRALPVVVVVVVVVVIVFAPSVSEKLSDAPLSSVSIGGGVSVSGVGASGFA